VSDTTELGIDVMVDAMTSETIDEKKLAQQLLEQSPEQGVGLIGPGGLLSGLTKTVLETALEAELTEHLGHEHGETPLGSKHAQRHVDQSGVDRNRAPARSGRRPAAGPARCATCAAPPPPSAPQRLPCPEP
jgi:hypothetical protein